MTCIAKDGTIADVVNRPTTKPTIPDKGNDRCSVAYRCSGFFVIA